MALYRQFESQEDIDQEYDLRHSVEDAQIFRDFYREQGQQARASIDHQLRLPYGPTLDETLDLFIPKESENAPICVFIHGGYWRSKTSQDYHMAAIGPCQKGMLTAVINYSLCPKVRIDEITRQNRAALAWLWKHSKDYGCLLYTSPSPRDKRQSRMPSSA